MISLTPTSMRSAALTTLAFTLCSLAPMAIAEEPMMPLTFSIPHVVSVGVRIKHGRAAGTPTWIGEYSNRWFHMQMTMSVPTGGIPDCLEAEGNPMKLLSLQRVGACPTVKTSTRIGW